MVLLRGVVLSVPHVMKDTQVQKQQQQYAPCMLPLLDVTLCGDPSRRCDRRIGRALRRHDDCYVLCWLPYRCCFGGWEKISDQRLRRDRSWSLGRTRVWSTAGGPRLRKSVPCCCWFAMCYGPGSPVCSVLISRMIRGGGGGAAAAADFESIIFVYNCS